ncbi:hypothetical protein [Glycomyces sp. NPDC048151]|uniref:hypothetical protein n=1 Tax=Glycomyces sp. NPDC048151 TaxID=3364002 RepID=UPI003722FD0F
MSSDRDETTALFRAHATARLRGDTAEADRLAARIGDEQRMSHMVFTLTLFAQYVREELGYEPDRANLMALTARLHEKHYRPGGSFEAIRGEAMVRAVTVEPMLLTEIPQNEQSAYMWAVIDELAEVAPTDADLAERFALAEEYGADMFNDALASPVFEAMRREDAQTGSPRSEAAQPDREPAGEEQSVRRSGEAARPDQESAEAGRLNREPTEAERPDRKPTEAARPDRARVDSAGAGAEAGAPIESRVSSAASSPASSPSSAQSSSQTSTPSLTPSSSQTLTPSLSPSLSPSSSSSPSSSPDTSSGASPKGTEA